MQTSRLTISAILISQLLFSSCARVFINEISRDSDLKLNQSNTLVIGSNELSLQEFVKTFNKNYKNKSVFIDEYITSVSSKLKGDKMFMNVGVDTSSRWDLIRRSYSVESSKVTDSLITASHVDYLLKIHDFEIYNRIQTMMTGGGPGMPMTQSSNEFCIVKARFELIDTNTKRVVMEFESIGEGGVLFFAFEAALRDATRKSIEHAIEYMKSRKVKF